jgi:alpha-1,2-mannosyltransferase
VRSGAPPSARRALQGVVVGAAIAGAWLLVFRVSPRPVWHHTFDLRVYRGAVRWWLDGHRVYDFVRPQTQKGFTYPPFAVLVLLPVAWGTETTATVLLTAVSAALVVLTTAWLIAPVAARHGWPRWVALGVAAPLAVAMEPVRETLGWGQIDLVVAALVLADVGALRRRRPWAGVGIGLATAIKVTPALFVVYLAVARRWRAAGIAAGTFCATVLVGFLVDPSTRYWTTLLWQTDRVGHPTNPNDQSLLGLLARLPGSGPPSPLVWAALAVGVLVGGLARAVALSRRGDDLAGITVTGLTACLISPISWVHHLYWVLPAVVVLVDIAAGTPVAAGRGGEAARPRAVRGAAAAAALVVTGAFACSLIWFFPLSRPTPWTVAGENAYVFLMVGLVAALPARELRNVLSGFSALRAQPRGQPSLT